MAISEHSPIAYSLRAVLLRCAPALFVPGALVAVAILLALARGAYFQSFLTDPDYDYLLNALTVAEFAQPEHTDHPGTTVQLLGGIVLQLQHLVENRSDKLREAVLRDPEAHLKTLNWALVTACAFGCLLGGWVVMRSATPAVGVAIQMSPLLSITSLVWLGRVAPESLLVALGVLLASLTWLLLQRDEESPALEIALGAVMALGAASKFTFLPVWLMAISAPKTWRARLRLIGAATVTFGVVVLPISARLGRTFRWLGDIATHTGHYGTGSVGFFDWSVVASALREVPTAEPFAVGICFASLVVGVAGVTRLRKTANRRVVITLLAAAVSQVLLLLTILKHPRTHYFIPGAMLAGLELVLVREVLAKAISHRVGKTIDIAMVVGVAGALTFNWFELQVRLDGMRWEDRSARTMAQVVGTDHAQFVLGIGVSDPAAALQHGNYYTNNRFAADLRRIYPDVLMWDWLGLHHFGAQGSIRTRSHRDESGRYFRYWASSWLYPADTWLAPGRTVVLSKDSSAVTPPGYREVVYLARIVPAVPEPPIR